MSHTFGPWTVRRTAGGTNLIIGNAEGGDITDGRIDCPGLAIISDTERTPPMPESISPVGAYAAAQVAFEGAILNAYGFDAHPAEGLSIGQREWRTIEAAFLEYRSAYTGAPLPAPGPNPLLHQAQRRAQVAIEWLMDFGEMTAAQAEAVTAITDALVLVSARLDEIEQAAR